MDITAKAMSEHILLGWENVKWENADGTEEVLEYSPEKAYELLRQPGADQFRDLIVSFAENADVYFKEQTKKREKKSATGSPGK